jgi:hypothetical protein
MVTYLEREGVVPRFIDAYVMGFDRPALRANPAHYRELVASISRELLVALAASCLARLPRYFLKKKLKWIPTADRKSEHQFRKEFFLSLASELGWEAGEREQFEADVKSYAATAAVPKPPTPGEVGAQHLPPSAAFVDRCAFLLDPSFLDQARHEAEKWIRVIEKSAEDLLNASTPAQ